MWLDVGSPSNQYSSYNSNKWTLLINFGQAAKPNMAKKIIGTRHAIKEYVRIFECAFHYVQLQYAICT